MFLEDERAIKEKYHERCLFHEKRYDDATMKHKNCGSAILAMALLKGVNEKKIRDLKLRVDDLSGGVAKF
jgi:hypothetical protein